MFLVNCWFHAVQTKYGLAKFNDGERGRATRAYFNQSDNVFIWLLIESNFKKCHFDMGTYNF